MMNFSSSPPLIFLYSGNDGRQDRGGSGGRDRYNDRSRSGGRDDRSRGQRGGGRGSYDNRRR
jgi:hypothetical protein